MTMAATAVLLLPAEPVYGNAIPLTEAAFYVVPNNGAQNFQITGVTINGNVCVGGSSAVPLNRPDGVNATLDFSSASTGQFQNNNDVNAGPAFVNYRVSAVAAALNPANSLSCSLGGLTDNLKNSGYQTTGQIDSPSTLLYRVVNVTSYNEHDDVALTLNEGGSGGVLIFGIIGINPPGEAAENGLTEEQVMWNFITSLLLLPGLLADLPYPLHP